MNNDMNIMSSGGDKKHMGDPGEGVYTILSFSSARNASTDLDFKQSSTEHCCRETILHSCCCKVSITFL